MVPCRAKPRTAVANRDRAAPESSSNGQRQESFLILIPERYRAVPFEPSDEEEASNDNELLSHLVKDLTDLHFDDSDLTTSICDLKASEQKSDLAKYRYISEAIKEHKLNFMAVMKTGKKKTCPNRTLIISLETQISPGIVFPLGDGLAAYYWESIKWC